MNSSRSMPGKPQRLTTDGKQKFAPRLSPAGDEIVFTWMETPRLLRLMRMKFADRKPEPVHNAASKSEMDPALSADGRYLAFVQLRGALSLALVIEERSGGQRAEVPPAAGFAGMRSPAIAPDGSRVVYSFAEGGNQQLFAVDVPGAGRRVLTEGPGINNWPAFSPDGERIAFSSSRAGKFNVYAMNADGKELRRLTDGARRDIRPCFSADSRRMAFTSYRDGAPRVYVMNADGSGVQRVETASEGDDYPCWHPDGKHLVVVSEVEGRRDLYQVEAPE